MKVLIKNILYKIYFLETYAIRKKWNVIERKTWTTKLKLTTLPSRNVKTTNTSWHRKINIIISPYPGTNINSNYTCMRFPNYFTKNF